MEKEFYCLLVGFALFKKNISENRLNKIFVHQVAVSDQNGVGDLAVSLANQNHALVPPPEPTGEHVSVNTVDLARILSKYDLSHVDLCKMDCEGGEYAIVNSLSAETARRISTFYIEYHDWVDGVRPSDLVNKLRGLGFAVESKTSHYGPQLGFILAQRKRS